MLISRLRPKQKDKKFSSSMIRNSKLIKVLGLDRFL
jgi:hypothetical protein